MITNDICPYILENDGDKLLLSGFGIDYNTGTLIKKPLCKLAPDDRSGDICIFDEDSIFEIASDGYKEADTDSFSFDTSDNSCEMKFLGKTIRASVQKAASGLDSNYAMLAVFNMFPAGRLLPSETKLDEAGKVIDKSKYIAAERDRFLVLAKDHVLENSITNTADMASGLIKKYRNFKELILQENKALKALNEFRIKYDIASMADGLIDSVISELIDHSHMLRDNFSSRDFSSKKQELIAAARSTRKERRNFQETLKADVEKLIVFRNQVKTIGKELDFSIDEEGRSGSQYIDILVNRADNVIKLQNVLGHVLASDSVNKFEIAESVVEMAEDCSLRCSKSWKSFSQDFHHLLSGKYLDSLNRVIDSRYDKEKILRIKANLRMAYEKPAQVLSPENYYKVIFARELCRYYYGATTVFNENKLIFKMCEAGKYSDSQIAQAVFTCSPGCVNKNIYEVKDMVTAVRGRYNTYKSKQVRLQVIEKAESVRE